VAPVFGVALAGRLLRLHRYPAFPSPESSTWARCNTRVSYPVPLQATREVHEATRVAGDEGTAPLAASAFIFSSAIAVETVGHLDGEGPPEPAAELLVLPVQKL
jgi:hypothetical protein